jgi:hypothetical protein
MKLHLIKRRVELTLGELLKELELEQDGRIQRFFRGILASLLEFGELLQLKGGCCDVSVT